MKEDHRRLFFGLEVEAPWPQTFPDGRLLEQKNRHLTLAFLGPVSYSGLVGQIESLPRPSFSISPVGHFDRPLSLHNVLAWHVSWWDTDDVVAKYQSSLASWLSESGYSVDKRPIRPHVTLARAPFSEREWRRAFYPIPLYARAVHLYESLGFSEYERHWSYQLQVPFEEIDHTADLAFRVYGENPAYLLLNAQAALAFSYPDLLPYINPGPSVDSLVDIVTHLNDVIRKADVEMGTPFKAVTYCGEIEEKGGLLQWEMIIDV